MPNDIANNMADTIHFLEEDNASMMKSLTDLQLAYNEQMIELREAKRLLKLAVENMNDGGCTRSCSTCKYGRDGCKYTEGYEWVHTEEAAKLFKED